MDICKTIRKVVGKGVQKTHEPMVFGNEKKYLISTIKQNFFRQEEALLLNLKKK